MPTKENILNYLIYIKSENNWIVEEKGNIFHITSSDKNYNFCIYIINEYDDFTLDGLKGQFPDKDLFKVLYLKINKLF